MRNGLLGLVTILTLASTLSTNGCNTATDPAGVGGSSNTGQTGGAGGSISSVGTGGSGTSSSTGGTTGSGTSSTTGGATGSGTVTDLSSTKPLSSLTTDELAQLCKDANAYYTRTISRATLCKARGLTYGVSSSSPTDQVLQDNCKAKETTCLQASPDSPSCDPFPSPCTATVAQYSACITEQAAAFDQGVTELVGCATATLKDLPAIWDFVTAVPPTGCTVLNDACAGVNYPVPH